MNRVRHMHIKRIIHGALFLLIFVTQLIMSEGFAAGTAVHTPVGFRPIEEIEPGHEVLSKVMGKIPGLPDNVKFISQDRLHKGEIEVFASRTKHIGAWVADKALTVLRWVKKAKPGREAFKK